MPTAMHRYMLFMTTEEINLVIGALSFLDSESMVNQKERIILKALDRRLEAIVEEST